MNKLTEHFFDSPTGIFTLPEVTVEISGSDFSRNGLIKRAISDGEILNIRRGLYCLSPKYQKKPLSVYMLAQRIYGPSYVSMETALSYHGWIPEGVFACTNACMKNAKEFDTTLGIFSYTRVPQKTFYAGVERCVDKNENVYFMASPAKALADYIYSHKEDFKNIGDAAESLRIEPEQLNSVKAEELSILQGNYSSKRVKRFLDSWMKEL